MLGNNGLKALGLVCAFVAGPAVYYLGSGLLSRHTRQDQSRSPSTAQKSQDGKQHEAKALWAALKKKPNHAPILLRLAQISEEAGNYSEAARHLQEILLHEPKNVEARLELGRIFFEAGDVGGAIEHTNMILNRQPDHADALYNMGAIYANLGNAELARRYWNRLFAANPQSASAQQARTMMAQLPPGGGPEAGNTATLAGRNYTLSPMSVKK